MPILARISSSFSFALRQKAFYSRMAAQQIKPAERVSHFSRDGNMETRSMTRCFL